MKGKYHLLLLPFILISLLIGIWTGLIRIGWTFPLAAISPEHGGLMVGSFLGTLIILERAVTFKNKLALLIPLVNVSSLIFFLTGLDTIGYWLLLAGSLGLTLIYLLIYLKHPDLHVIIMMIGSLCWAVGNMLLIKTQFYPTSVTWWIAFLFYTILGERLELSKYLFINKTAKTLFLFFLAVFLIGIFIPFHGSGGYVFAFSLIASAVWLFRYDMAGKSISKEGGHRFSGIALLIGYGWLIICGLFMAYGAYRGLLYDAALHTFFIGFVFLMIFAHAPIILPGILGLPVSPFHWILYIWLILLELSLIIRYLSLFTGDLTTKFIGSLLNGIIIVLFFITMIILTRIKLNEYNAQNTDR